MCVCDVCLDVNQGGKNCNRCTQRLVILRAQTYTNEPWSYTKNQVCVTYFTGQNGQLKKMGVNTHFHASWASQAHECLLFSLVCRLRHIAVFLACMYNVDDSDFCLGKNDGLYMVSGNCSAYYRCVKNETYVHLCPDDLVFSDIRKQCLPLRRVPEREAECTSSPRYLLVVQICCTCLFGSIHYHVHLLYHPWSYRR